MAGPTPSNQFSFSRVKCYRQCPAQYRYRYVDRLTAAFRSVETYLGNTVHDVLEWLYERRDADAADPAAEVADEEFARRWHEGWEESIAVVRVDDEADSYFELGRRMLRDYHSGTFSVDRSTTVALEARLNARLSPEVVFTGFADRIGRTVNGRLFVIDYKTSRQLGDPSELSEGLQAPLYAACALDRHGAEEAAAGYHYLRHGVTNWHSVDRTKARAVLDRFLELADETRSATDFPARPGVLCAWCGFNHLCPAAEVPEAFAGGLLNAQRRSAESLELKP